MTSINRFLILFLATCIVAGRAHAADRSAYRNPNQPIEKRIEDLLGRMTIEEKVGQMNMPCVYESGLGGNMKEKTDGVQKFAAGTMIKGFGPGAASSLFPTRSSAKALGNRRSSSTGSSGSPPRPRLGIPLLQSEEGTHGLMCPGGTVFPEGPGLGSTWNMDLLTKVYTAVAKEARSIGVHQTFTLVIEPIRDPRLGRNEEAFSEDPYLCSRIAERIVRARTGKRCSAPDKVVAGLCHYPGQSQPVSGFDAGRWKSPSGVAEVLPVVGSGHQGCGATWA